jgi:thiol peroxidase
VNNYTDSLFTILKSLVIKNNYKLRKYKIMANITFKGNPVTTVGELPVKGNTAPDFSLVDGKLNEVKLSDYRGKNVVLNIFPSLDTGTCAASVRRFNKEAAALNNTVVLGISADLPFAAGRFCSAEGIENVVTLSNFRDESFGKDYGLLMTDGPLKGLLARAVVVVNPEGKVVYTELVPEIHNFNTGMIVFIESKLTVVILEVIIVVCDIYLGKQIITHG